MKYNEGDTVIRITETYNGYKLEPIKIEKVKKFSDNNIVIIADNNKYTPSEVWTKDDLLELF